MRGVLQIARTEILEHRRQPWMLFILAASYVLFIGLFGVFFLLFDAIARQPESLALITSQMEALGVSVSFDTILVFGTASFGTVVFAYMPLVVAIMAGYSVLHDRACGTMPFLMLAPITRRQLLLGKVAGAMALPLLFHLVFVGSSTLLLGRLELLAPYSDKFGGSLAWWIAFLVGAPASAAFVGALGAVNSALSNDVRTSVQYTNFFMNILGPVISYALVNSISQGAGLQIVYAAGCLVAAALTLLVGARLISKDVAPS
jgi:ABC-type transport system involved in multi-copper enzyme maturation permease subunit